MSLRDRQPDKSIEEMNVLRVTQKRPVLGDIVSTWWRYSNKFSDLGHGRITKVSGNMLTVTHYYPDGSLNLGLAHRSRHRWRPATTDIPEREWYLESI